jgi:S-adenosylmethionine hydrolase
MFVLFTDFGRSGPYVGQMHAVLAQEAPSVPVIDLLSDAPAFNPKASAYLLAALAGQFPPGTIVVAVIDPGVGTAEREAVVLEADGRRFVGPGNGLFELVARRASRRRWWRIAWRQQLMSASFHGRDLFAPVAARIARGEWAGLEPMDKDRTGEHWSDDLAEVIYIDDYGNAMTGLRGDRVAPGSVIVVGGARLEHARTFGDMPLGGAFWYVNSAGLVELSVNQGRADERLGLRIGTAVQPRDNSSGS